MALLALAASFACASHFFSKRLLIIERGPQQWRYCWHKNTWFSFMAEVIWNAFVYPLLPVIYVTIVNVTLYMKLRMNAQQMRYARHAATSQARHKAFAVNLLVISMVYWVLSMPFLGFRLYYINYLFLLEQEEPYLAVYTILKANDTALLVMRVLLLLNNTVNFSFT